jgi:hypothetical protein
LLDIYQKNILLKELPHSFWSKDNMTIHAIFSLSLVPVHNIIHAHHRLIPWPQSDDAPSQ